MSLLDDLGIDPEHLEWEELAACRAAPIKEFVKEGGPGHPFFEGYEGDPAIARAVDAMCESCVVKDFCAKYGKYEADEGVYAGAYLVNGRVSESKNSHKTEEEMAEARRYFKNI